MEFAVLFVFQNRGKEAGYTSSLGGFRSRVSAELGPTKIWSVERMADICLQLLAAEGWQIAPNGHTTAVDDATGGVRLASLCYHLTKA